MILYLKDWDKFPNAIVDDKTTNEEWVRLAGVYKAMGVQNYYFHLALLQPELQGVNPLDEKNLTIEQQVMIQLEIKYNPWYFFREILRLPNGNNPLRFKANRGNISLLWSFFSCIDYGLTMIRQMGKSVTGDGLVIWLMGYYYEKTDLFLFTKDDDLRRKTILRIKGTINLLPTYLNPWNKKDADNQELIECSQRTNFLRTKVGQTQKFLAEGAGRGLTSPFTIVEEGPYIPNAHISIPAIIAATGTARENYEETGEYYGNLYLTTAGKLDSKEGKYMYNFLHSGMKWNEKILDCENKEAAHHMVRTHSPKGRLLIYGVFSHRQLGRTDEWLRRRILLAEATKEEIERDYFNKWSSGTESGAIPSYLLEIIRESEIEPICTLVQYYMIKYYIEEIAIETRLNQRDYVLGVDTSDAIGRDANAIVLTDSVDLSVTAVSIISEANLHNYAKWLAKFLITHKKVTFVIEAKSSARSIIDTITELLVAENIDPFKRMYNRIVDNHKVMKDEFSEISELLYYRNETIYLKNKKYIGFNNTGASRTFLYDTVLNDAVKSSAHLVRDSELADELKALIIKNGRVGHPEDGHDDCVIAWLLTHWFLKHTKNLSYYGIDTLNCLTLVSDDGATIDEEGIRKREQIAKLTNEINVLKQELIKGLDIVESIRVEKTLAFKVAEANKLGDLTINLDQIMKVVNETKSSKKNLRAAVNKLNFKRLGFTQHR